MHNAFCGGVIRYVSIDVARILHYDKNGRKANTLANYNSVQNLLKAEPFNSKYYEVVYILFHTEMRISQSCGLTLCDLDMENRVINIDHQLQRIGDMKLVI